MHAGAILMNYNIYLPLLVSVNTMRFRGYGIRAQHEKSDGTHVESGAPSQMYSCGLCHCSRQQTFSYLSPCTWH